jgi:hypothetical protein
MEILNKNGMILMDYRREFKRHYADSVDDALKDAILTLYKEGQIPEKLFRIILDDKVDDSVVYTYLLSRREFTKSSMELNSAFNEVREKVNDYLIKIDFVKNVCTKNSVQTNRIYVIKQYDVPKDLLLSYFGLTPSEIIPLMKRKGFMDKFCVLRLSQAFKEIYNELDVPEHIDHGYSLIYYNKLIQGFSIDYKYMVNINYISDETHLKDLMDKIKALDAIVDKKFEGKMSYKYFSELNKRMNAIDLSAEIDKIVIPVRSGKRSQDIRKPEFIIDEVEKQQSGPELVVEDDLLGEADESPKKKPEPIIPSVDMPVPPKKEKTADTNATTEVKPPVQPPVKNEKPGKKPEEAKPVAEKPVPHKQAEQKPAPQKNEVKPADKKQVEANPVAQQKGKEPQKTETKAPEVKQNQPQQNQPKQPAKPQPKQQPSQKEQRPVEMSKKPNNDDDDEDDLLETTPKKKPTPPAAPKPNNGGNTPAKPALVVDDSDLDMI